MSSSENRFYEDLSRRLAEYKDQGLERKLRALYRSEGKTFRYDGRDLLSFSSNDYLGFGSNAELWTEFKKRLNETGDFSGFGSNASPLIRGHFTLTEAVAGRLALWLGFESVLFYPSGFQANAGVLQTLAKLPDAVFLVDRLCHASILDGISGANFRRYAHLDYGKLEKQLASRKDNETVFVVSDALFSMDGDMADLKALVALKEKYNFCLIIDDTHGVGVLGPTYRGLIESLLDVDETGETAEDPFKVVGQVDILVGNFSKGFAGQGGYVASNTVLADYQINFSRPFIYSTALSPVALLYADTALDFIQTGTPQSQMRENIEYFLNQCEIHSLNESIPDFEKRREAGSWMSPVIPFFPTGDIMEAMELAVHAGLYLVAIRPPTVPKGSERFRLSISAGHTPEDIDSLVAFLKTVSIK